MTPTDIARSYDQLAEEWNCHRFPRDNGITQHKRAIAFVRQRRYAVDVGCGSSGRIIDLLTTYGFVVEGLDISGRMVELAKKRHPNVTFHHADICEWQLPRAYDFISAWDSIWHIPLSQHEAVLKKLLRVLNRGGVCIFTMGGLDHPSEKIASAMGPQMYYSVLGMSNTLKLLSDTGCVCRHLEYDQYPELHVYVIAEKV